MEEKAELESRYQRDICRETQLLEDFEWKLHEIERDYKNKIAESERQSEEKIKNEMAAQLQQLMEDKRSIDEQLNQVDHYFTIIISLLSLVIVILCLNYYLQ